MFWIADQARHDGLGWPLIWLIYVLKASFPRRRESRKRIEALIQLLAASAGYQSLLHALWGRWQDHKMPGCRQQW